MVKSTWTMYNNPLYEMYVLQSKHICVVKKNNEIYQWLLLIYTIVSFVTEVTSVQHFAYMFAFCNWKDWRHTCFFNSICFLDGVSIKATTITTTVSTRTTSFQSTSAQRCESFSCTTASETNDSTKICSKITFSDFPQIFSLCFRLCVLYVMIENWNHHACATEETFLQDFLEILKHLFLHF